MGIVLGVIVAGLAFVVARAAYCGVLERHEDDFLIFWVLLMITVTVAVASASVLARVIHP